jgi:hypothetical protein
MGSLEPIGARLAVEEAVTITDLVTAPGRAERGRLNFPARRRNLSLGHESPGHFELARIGYRGPL